MSAEGEPPAFIPPGAKVGPQFHRPPLPGRPKNTILFFRNVFRTLFRYSLDSWEYRGDDEKSRKLP